MRSSSDRSLAFLEFLTVLGLLALFVRFADPLTWFMVGLVALVWLRLTWSGWRWRGIAGDEDFTAKLEARAERAAVLSGRASFLPEGASEALVAEVADGRDWRFPWWFALGQPVLISLGLVGTFVGLTYGLSEVDLQGDLDGAMAGLFAGAKLAFVKSLAGVWCGMVWSARFRQLEERHADLLAAARDALDERFPPISQHQLLANLAFREAEQHTATTRQLEALRDELRQGLAAMQATTRDEVRQGFAAMQATTRDEVRQGFAASQATTRAVALELDGAIAQVGKAQATRLLDGARELVTVQLTTQTAALVAEIATASDTLHDQLSQLAETLPGSIGGNTASVLQPQFAELTRSLRDLSERGGSAIGDAFQASMAGETGRLRGSLAEIASLLEQLGPKVTAQLDAADRRVQDGAQQAAASLTQAGALASKHLQDAAGQFSAETTQVQEAMGAVRETLAETHRIAQAMRGAGQEMKAGLEGVAGSLSVLPPVLERARVAVDSSSAALTRGSEATTAVATASERTVSVLQRVTATQEILTGRGEQLSRDVEALRAASEALAKGLNAMTAGQQAANADSLRALSETAARFGAALEQAQTTVSAASRSTFEDARAMTAEVVGKLATVLETGSARLEGALDKLAARATDLDRGLQAAHVAVEAMDGRAQALRESAEAVSAPFGAIATALQRVAPEVRLASDAVKAERDALSGLGRQLEAQGEQLAARVREQQALQALLSREWATHVQGVEAVLAKVRTAWADAIRAADEGVGKNARELGEYARAVENSLKLPNDLRRLTQTLEELNDVLDSLAATLKVNE